MGIALEAVVIRRITTLDQEVDAIQDSSSSTLRVSVTSADEVTDLSTHINGMLDSLEAQQQQLEANNAALQVAYEQAEEATRLKSQFLSTMSHELRTPLNAVIGYAGIMLEGIGGEIDEDAEEMIGNIQESSQHLLKLINDVLDISKIEAGRLEIVPEPFAVRMLANALQEQMQVLGLQKKYWFQCHD